MGNNMPQSLHNIHIEVVEQEKENIKESYKKLNDECDCALEKINKRKNKKIKK
jgi:hypothetical protein